MDVIQARLAIMASKEEDLVTISTKALDLLWSLAVLEGDSEPADASADERASKAVREIALEMLQKALCRWKLREERLPFALRALNTIQSGRSIPQCLAILQTIIFT